MRLRCASVATLALLSSGSLFSDSLSWFLQTNLVSDIPGQAAFTDSNLKDAWGMSFSATSPIWVSDRATGVTTVYTGSGGPPLLTVAVPPGAPNGPTGQVFAGPTTSFALNGKPAFFIFDTLGGTVDAWNGGPSATVVVTTSGARYEGLAMANNTLFAANFVTGGGVNVFSATYTPISVPGKFTDPNIPAGYEPFNVAYLNGELYVEYAKVNSTIPVPLPGNGGYVDVFDTSGTLVKRLISNGALDAPWGITMAPSSGFGQFSGDLLVGNFGNGEINVYNPTTGAWIATLTNSSGAPISISGLWAIEFGNSSANPHALYFTAGPNRGANGLFGDIQAVPEPGAIGLTVLGMLGLLGYAGQRRSKTKDGSSR